MPILISVLTLILMAVALVDIITRDDSQVKHLPKIFWIILVILLPFVGSLIWFGVGREYSGGGIRMPRRSAPAPQAPQAPPAVFDRRTTEEQMADLDREIEEWRLRMEIEKRKNEQTQREQGEAGDPA